MSTVIKLFCSVPYLTSFVWICFFVVLCRLHTVHFECYEFGKYLVQQWQRLRLKKSCASGCNPAKSRAARILFL